MPLATAWNSRITLTVVVFTSLIAATRGENCGKPGTPTNGGYSPIKMFFNRSEIVSYYCTYSSYNLVGSSTRTCLSNGTWDSPIPTCELNLAYNKTVVGDPYIRWQNLVDNDNGKNSYCTLDKPRPITVNLGREEDIADVVLTLNPHQSYSLEISVKGSQNQPQRQCKAIKNERTDEPDLRLVCNNGQKLRGQYVTITVEFPTAVYGIAVHSPKGVSSCGQPDIPIHGVVNILPQQQVEFSCLEGYFLLGEPLSYCINDQWNTSGQYCVDQPAGWTGCGEPGLPMNGDRFIGGRLQNESNYFCSRDYVLVGSPLRVCQLNGTWTPQIPKCVSNLALNKLASHQQGSVKKAASTDGNATTCESQASKYDGYIDLETARSFNNVILALKSNVLVAIAVYASNYSNFGAYSSTICATYVYPTSPIQCNHSEMARYVVIRFNQSISVCEVTVFDTNEQTNCGQPDQPLHGRILDRNYTQTTYTCDHGYTMNGLSTTNCVKGVWNRNPPTCKPIQTTTTTTTTTYRPTISTQKTTTPRPDTYTTHEHSENNDSMAMGIMGIAVGATAACVAIILVSVLVYCFVRKHYKSRRKPSCDHDHSSKGSRSDCYTTTYRIGLPERRSGDGDDVSIHLYDTIKEPDYLFQRRPMLPDTVSNDLYDSGTLTGSLTEQRHHLLPHRPNLYDSVAPEHEGHSNDGRLEMALPSPDDPLLDCANRPLTSL